MAYSSTPLLLMACGRILDINPISPYSFNLPFNRAGDFFCSLTLTFYNYQISLFTLPA